MNGRDWAAHQVIEALVKEGGREENDAHLFLLKRNAIQEKALSKKISNASITRER